VTKQIRPKRKKADRRESCSYVIEILDWDFDYSLRLDPKCKISARPYWEYTSLILQGRFVEPQKLAGRDVKVILLGNRNIMYAMEKPLEFDWEPKSIGWLTVTKSQTEYLWSVPLDVFQLIVSSLTAGKIRFLSLHGETLYRGQTSIKSATLESTYVPEED
jgi:hypothetical protein